MRRERQLLAMFALWRNQRYTSVFTAYPGGSKTEVMGSCREVVKTVLGWSISGSLKYNEILWVVDGICIILKQFSTFIQILALTCQNFAHNHPVQLLQSYRLSQYQIESN